MTRHRRLPRHLLDVAAGGRTAPAPRTTTVAGPVAEAWLAAVESALAPPTRAMARRRLASARIGRVTLTPGSVRAEVRQESYRSQVVEVRMPEVDDAAWERLLAAAARHGRWLAALAAGVLPDDLASALLDAGLAPSGADLVAGCTCRPLPGMCVHAGIAGHVAARALSTEPAGMLLLRGLQLDRLRERILHRLPGAKADGTTRDPAEIDWNPNMLGSQASPPEPLPAPERSGRPAPVPPPPAGSGLEGADLDSLAADAAARALDLLLAGGGGGLDLDADADLARRAAAMSGEATDVLAGRTGVDSAELAAMASAWRIGGPGAVDALRRTWRPSSRVMEPGIAALGGLYDGVAAHLNRVTIPHGRVELSLGRDGLWYLLRRDRRLSPAFVAAPGAADPLTLVDASPPRGATAEAEQARRAAEQLRLL